MSRIRLTSEAPGIVGLLQTFPKIGHAMSQLAQTLLVDPIDNVLIPRWFREYIAASCSHRGDTDFCHQSHLAAALASSPYDTIDEMIRAVQHTLKYVELEKLAHIAYSRPGTFQDHDTHASLNAGASNEEVHLAVAIACAFRMYNAYVKTIGNPGLEGSYEGMGVMLASKGYL